MILLIEAGGMRSSAALSSSTAPVSTSMTKACVACVSMPAVGYPGAWAAAAVGFALAWPRAPAAGWPLSPATSKTAAITAAIERAIKTLPIFRSAIFRSLSLPDRERPPPGRRSVLTTLQQSTSRHAVGEIPDRGREIRGLVPLHDRAEIVIDEEGRPTGAIRHD